MGSREDIKSYGTGLLASGTVGSVFGLVITLLLLFAASLLMEAEKLPMTLSEEAIITATFAGAAAAGLIAGRRQGRRVLLAGLGAGLLCLLITKLIAACLPQGNLLNPLSIKTAIAAVTGGTFGGALLTRGKKQKKSRRGK